MGRLKAEPGTADGLKAEWRKQFDTYEAERHKWLAEHLERHRGGGNPFDVTRLMQGPYVTAAERRPPLVLWSEVEQCLEKMQGGITEKARQKKVAKIETRLAEINTELDALRPAAFLHWQDGRIQCDCRVKFIEHWREVQSQIAEPCGVLGDGLTDMERPAWKALVSEYLNPSASFLPADSTDDRHSRPSPVFGRFIGAA